MSHERVVRQIVGIIKSRKEEIEKGLKPNIRQSYDVPKNPKDMPVVDLPESVNILLNSPSLWIKTEEDEYTPHTLVRAFFERKDGGDIIEDKFAVFIADNKRYIAKNWGIIPPYTWNKQKGAYWNREFVVAIFTHRTLAEKPDAKYVNRIEYLIRKDITFEEMEHWYFQANVRAVEVDDTLKYNRTIKTIRERERYRNRR